MLVLSIMPRKRKFFVQILVVVFVRLENSMSDDQKADPDHKHSIKYVQSQTAVAANHRPTLVLQLQLNTKRSS